MTTSEKLTDASQGLAKLSHRAKEAEDHAAAARNQAKADVDKSQADLKDTGVKLAAAKQKLADFAAGKATDPASPAPKSAPVLADNFSAPRPASKSFPATG